MAPRQLDFRFEDNRSYVYRPGIDGGLHRWDVDDASAPCQKVKRWGGADWSTAEVWTNLANLLRDRLSALRERKTNAGDKIVVVRTGGYSHDTDDDFLTITPLAQKGFSIETGNLIGTVIRREPDGTVAGEVSIGSRFGDGFLRYIISDADGFVRLKNFGGADQSAGYEWLLDYLWNATLRSAFRLGLPKCYCTKSERLVGVRGGVDPVDFYGYELRGNVRCSFREMSYDNPAAELFVAAWRTLRCRNASRSFCPLTTQIYQAFLQAVCGGSRKRSELLGVKPFSNAFYAEYNKLIALSKIVLRRGSSDFSSDNQTDALLFDVAMLFEYYIRKLLKRNGFRLILKEHELYRVPTCALTGSAYRKLIPDLVFEVGDGVGVFDVKYKYFKGDEGVAREDVFQLHTYIGQYGNDKEVRTCGFIYPISESRWRNFRGKDLEQVVLSAPLCQQGREIPFHVAFLVVPDCGSQAEDCTDVEFAKKIEPWVGRLVNQLTESVHID